MIKIAHISSQKTIKTLKMVIISDVEYFLKGMKCEDFNYWEVQLLKSMHRAVKNPSTIQTRSRRTDLFGRQLIFGGRLLKLLRTFVQFTRLTHTLTHSTPFDESLIRE